MILKAIVNVECRGICPEPFDTERPVLHPMNSVSHVVSYHVTPAVH